MLKASQLKENDVFYYALHTYTSENKELYMVIPYLFNLEYHQGFDENLMFATEKEARAKVDELNKELGW